MSRAPRSTWLKNWTIWTKKRLFFVPNTHLPLLGSQESWSIFILLSPNLILIALKIDILRINANWQTPSSYEIAGSNCKTRHVLTMDHLRLESNLPKKISFVFIWVLSTSWRLFSSYSSHSALSIFDGLVSPWQPLHLDFHSQTNWGEDLRGRATATTIREDNNIIILNWGRIWEGEQPPSVHNYTLANVV